MRFISTRGSESVSLKEAIQSGLAPDGGLYLPVEIARLPPAEISSFRDRDFPEIAAAIGTPFLSSDLRPGEIRELVEDAFDFEVELLELAPEVFCLELFHGPSLAFKDFGARFLSRLIAHFCPRRRTILVATSGDTGGAVAHGFRGIEGIDVVILFPLGRISALQEKQMTTLGGNIRCFGVEGSFDDCQRLVREAFLDRELGKKHALASANSINIGRLIPQTFYYFYACSRLPRDAGKPFFSVPSGNFGNVTAGLIAKRMGLPAGRFIAATNRNDTVPLYLKTARFQPKASLATLSNAMDVGNPSNLERLRGLYRDDLDRLRNDLTARSFRDSDTKEAMRRVYESSGYVLDPHSAVGYLGLESARESSPGSTGIFLATAHPAKFPEAVEAATGRMPDIPDHLALVLRRESTPGRIRPTLDALKEALG